MDLNYTPLIKQEYLNVEDQFVTVKNEPILDEDGLSLVSIKNEPLVEAALTDNLIVKDENHVSTGDSFIIYELETPQNDKQIQNNNTPIIRPTFQLPLNTNVNQINPPPINFKEKISTKTQNLVKESIEATIPTSASTAIPSLVNTQFPTIDSTRVEESTKSTFPASAPILLNTQFRKRNKNVLHPTSSLDKRTRYNIEGSIVKNSKTGIQSLKNNSNKSLASGSKKIINHLIQHKRVQRKQELINELNFNPDFKNPTEPPSHCGKTNLKLSPADLENPAEQPSHCDNTNLKLSNQQTQLSIKLESKDLDNHISSQSLEITATLTSQTENILTKAVINPPFASPPIERSISPKDLQAASNTPELRVKCLCRLTDVNSQITDTAELTEFFKQMFEETRRLTKQQQRHVKMSLLQAISEAEDAAEQGKCCF